MQTPDKLRIFCVSHEDDELEVRGMSMTLDEGNLVIISESGEPAAFFAKDKWYSCVEKTAIYDEDDVVDAPVFF